MSIKHLTVSWSVSRGRNTYGYNICRLDDYGTGKRYRCNGGGYDMQGTVFAEWLQDQYQKRMQATNITQLYGAYRHTDGTISLDGACGLESMLAVARAIGLDVQSEYSRRGALRGFLVSEVAL